MTSCDQRALLSYKCTWEVLLSTQEAAVAPGENCQILIVFPYVKTFLSIMYLLDARCFLLIFFTSSRLVQLQVE